MQSRVVLAAIIVMSCTGAAFASNLSLLSDFQGIRYTEQGRPVGMPMGGVGAGTIEVSSAGTLMEFRNVNNWAARIPSIPGSGLWVTYRSDDVTKVYDLSRGRVIFEGNFPFAKLRFPDLPFKVTLWCWSPFVLHDLRHSAYPVAIFDAEIKNTTKEDAQIGFAVSYGTDYSDWLTRVVSGRVDTVSVRVVPSWRTWSGANSEGVRFDTRAELDAAAMEARITAIRKKLEDAYLRAYDYTPLDISAVCNRNYSRHPFGDDKPHENLDFADLAPGRRTVYNIPFQIVDPAKGDGSSCVVVGAPSGVDRVTIPVHQKADCLFFFGNCGGWVAGEPIAGEYIVNYADGTKETVSLRRGYEISDWMGGSAAYSPVATAGKSSSGSDYVIHIYAIPTDGDKEIDSIELAKAGSAAPVLFAITLGKLSDTPLAEGVIAMRRTDIDRMAGSVGSIKLVSNTDGNYVLAARRKPGGRVYTYAVEKPEALVAALRDGPLADNSAAAVFATEQRFHIPAGKSAVASLVCAWYTPNHRNQAGHRFGKKYEDWFAHAGEVAEEVARDHDRLLALTKKHYDIIATSSLPKDIREMIQSNFYLLPACTWLTRDGIAFTYETPEGCPLFGTMDVRYYGSFTQLAAFPEIDQIVLRQFASVQHADGFIQHDLGGTEGISDNYAFPPMPRPDWRAPSKNRADYTGYWTNLPIKFCLQVARSYWWTGDKEFLREMWPSVKRAIAWVQAQDEDDDGLPETQYGYDGWTMIDKCGYDANQWCVMLVAIARCARDLGESNYAAELLATHVKARDQIEKLLWTGSYYKQSAGVGGSKDLDWVSLIQLAGTWYADILGFDDGLPSDHVQSAIKTIHEVLSKDVRYGLVDARHPDASPINWWICDGVGIGWNFYFMTHAMYRNQSEIALNVADEVWREFMVEVGRIPWCQEEFIHDPKNGTCPYWLLRDQRMGVTMAMSYAIAGLKLDVPARNAQLRPADWIWRQGKFTLPIVLPKWLGQVRYSRKTRTENYFITNIDKPLKLKSLKLRTVAKSEVQVTIHGVTRQLRVDPNGTVDIGAAILGPKPLLVKLTEAR